ncbi:MAG: 3-hydroxyacyl-ACP dehydratase FabZ family protein [Planctomycetota bacterium]
MAVKPLIEASELNFEQPVFDIHGIRARNPHRHHMEMLDSIVHFNPERGTIAGVKQVRDDAFWVSGHFPGRPIMPGVLMIEAAGQLGSFYCQEVNKHKMVLVFASIESARFRGFVVPGDRLVVLCKLLSARSNATRFDTQGFVGDNLIFECQLLGMLSDMKNT